MKIRKLLMVLLCLVFASAMAACGGSGSGGEETETKETEAEEEATQIEVSGEEFSSGDLSVSIPDGWEVCPGVENWEEDEQIKFIETANRQEVGDSVYGDVYIQIDLSDYTQMDSAYDADANKEYEEEYNDESAVAAEYVFNENTFIGFRDYMYVGDSGNDWRYLAFAADGRLIEIRAYADADLATDDNQAAMRSLLASLRIGGEPVSSQEAE